MYIEYMLCMLCKQNPAKFNYTQIGEGDKMQKVDLCETAPNKKGVRPIQLFGCRRPLAGLGRRAGNRPLLQWRGDRVARAAASPRPISRRPDALAARSVTPLFPRGWKGLLKTMHKGIKHVGKVPAALRQGRDLSERLKHLQKKLDRAVTAEDFEQAASLRDEIKLAKEQLDTCDGQDDAMNIHEFLSPPVETRPAHRSARPDCDVQPRPAGAQFARDGLSRLGQEKRAGQGAWRSFVRRWRVCRN